MTLKQLFYPPRCPFCGKIMPQEEPCENCLKQATELTAVVCEICGADPEHCSCRDRSFAFHRNVSAFLYERSVRRLVLRFKEGRKPQLSEFMGRRIYHHIMGRLGNDFSLITFVPQSRYKSFTRGYCPARLLAETVSRKMNLPCVSALKRIGGRPQKRVGAKERWENAKRSFALENDIKIDGKVLLIDDVTTTGATLNACSTLLLKAGAKEVYCATFAITAKKS